LTVYFMVFPRSAALEGDGHFQDQEDQDFQDTFGGFEASKSRASRVRKDKIKRVKSRGQEQNPRGLPPYQDSGANFEAVEVIATRFR
jgi:hypothetical protein